MLKLKIYVIHTATLEVRKSLVETLFEKIKQQASGVQLEVEWLTNYYEPGALDQKLVSEKIKLGKNEQDPSFDMFARNLHVKQVSNVLKHAHALQRAAEEASSYDYFLVIEDDVIFVDDIGTQLEKFMKKNNSIEWDILFLGQPSTKDYGNKQGEVILRPVQDTFKVLPCCDSYILKSSVAKASYEQFLPIQYTANVHWSFVLSNKLKDFKAMASVPNIMVDGSKFGIYISTLDPNNKLFMNPDYNRIHQVVINGGDLDAALAQLDTIKFKTHPDITHLTALIYKQKGKYEKAVELMENAYNLYKSNGAIVNSESDILKDYIAIYQHMQKDLDYSDSAPTAVAAASVVEA